MIADLRARRKAAGLALADAAAILQIERRVLAALEDGRKRRWRIDDPEGLAARARALYAGRELPPLGPCVNCAFRPGSPETEPYSAPGIAETGETAVAFITDRQIRKKLVAGDPPIPFRCHRWMPRFDDGKDPWEGDYDPAIAPGGAPLAAPVCVNFERAVEAILAEMAAAAP